MPNNEYISISEARVKEKSKRILLIDQVTATQINPRHILAQIVQHKEQEIAQIRQQLTLGDFNVS